MVEREELDEKKNGTIGFGVNGSPIWLFKALVDESKEFYGDVYWPVLVGWFRDAMTYRQLREEGLMVSSLNKEALKVDEKADDKRPKLMG